MDCLEGQSKVAENFKKLKLEQEIIKDASLFLRKASKVVCIIRSMSHDWYTLSHCPSKQSMHALRSQLGNVTICLYSYMSIISPI